MASRAVTSILPSRPSHEGPTKFARLVAFDVSLLVEGSTSYDQSKRGLEYFGTLHEEIDEIDPFGRIQTSTEHLTGSKAAPATGPVASRERPGKDGLRAAQTRRRRASSRAGRGRCRSRRLDLIARMGERRIRGATRLAIHLAAMMNHSWTRWTYCISVCETKGPWRGLLWLPCQTAGTCRRCIPYLILRPNTHCSSTG